MNKYNIKVKNTSDGRVTLSLGHLTYSVKEDTESARELLSKHADRLIAQTKPTDETAFECTNPPDEHGNPILIPVWKVREQLIAERI